MNVRFAAILSVLSESSFMDFFDLTGLTETEKAMVSFVGAGGKTSAMFRMSKELKKRGLRVLVTTTTAIFYPDSELYDNIILENDLNSGRITDHSIQSSSVTVIGKHKTEDGKLKGIDPEYLNMLFGKEVFDYILVEADGSKQRPIKAPSEHEPVIPSKTTLVIGIVGFDSYNKPLSPEWVHRPELLAALSGRGIGEQINAEVFIKLCSCENGLFKGSPLHAGKLVLLNKVRMPNEFISAEDIGRKILGSNSEIQRVIIGSIQEGTHLTVVERS